MPNPLRPIDLEPASKQETTVDVGVTPEVSVSETDVLESAQSIEKASVEVEEGTLEDVPTDTSEITTDLLAVPTPVSVQSTEEDRLEEEIEDILEEDLKEMYVTLSPDKQAEFREKGEETRSRVRKLVQGAHINAKKIFQLIRAWLKIIPGVNRFFLEQEAKIKTDKILFITEEERKRKQNENM